MPNFVTWPIAEQRLRAFENRVQRRIFEPKMDEDRKLENLRN
jgi:hypothetical protein